SSVITVRAVQAVLSAVSCVLLAAAGNTLWGRRGMLAGLALAVYAPAIFLDSLVDKTCLVTLLTTGLLALVVSARWAAAGAVLGLLTLTRENAIVLAAPILLWILVGPQASRRGAAAFGAACLLVLVPVGIRNYAVGGEFHLTTSQFGPNFYIGN